MRSSNGLLYRGLALALALTPLVSVLPVAADPVDWADAQAMARGWLAEGQTRLGASLSDKVKSTQTFSGFHVVNLQPEGYIVTGADDDVEPVIAFSSKGHFETNPENPLWILLNRDVPERTAHIRSVKGRPRLQAAPGLPPDPSAPDEQARREAARSKAKWDRFRKHAASVSAFGPSAGAGVSSLEPAPPGGDSNPVSRPGFVRITTFRLLEGQVQITHDSPRSVSILASYDAGNSWLTLDSGIFQSTWNSSRATRESGCWFRVEEDGLMDEMTVGFMRNPPPVLETATNMAGGADSDVPGDEPLSSAYLSAVSDVRIAPLIQSRWSQSGAQGYNCYNYYTPNNYVCGCVATAVAQLLRYWQHPVAGVGQISRTVYVNGASQTATTRGGNGTGGPYNWSAMPLAPGSTPYNAAQWQMIGALCYDAAVSVSMQFSAGGSGAYMSSCANAFMSVFGYANARYNYPPNLLIPINSNLAAGCPVLLGIDNHGASGHAIVCDGFGYSSGTMYHHLNLGWGGSWDLWYTLPNIGGAYPWNSVHCIIFNVFPTGAGELIAGRVTTTAGVPVQGATLTASASGQNYTATSDAKGYYGVKVPAARSYSVTASKAGMSNATRAGVGVGTSAYATCGNAVDVDFALNPFSITAVALTNSVWLRWATPTNCGMANNTVYIRWRTDRYPSNASDGTEVYAGNAQVFEHKPVDGSGGVTNFYAIWGNDGSPYAAFGGASQVSAAASSGSLKLYWTNPSSGRAAVWHIRNDGSLRGSGIIGTYSTGWALVGAGDVNRDGTPDLIWHHAALGKVACWMISPDGVLLSSGFSGDISTGWVLKGVGDIDRDDTADLVWFHAAQGKAAYWLLNPDGTKRTSGYAGSVTGGWSLIASGDIDRDGTMDLLWQNTSLGKVAYWFLKTDGTIRTTGYVGNITPGWNFLGCGDMNRDETPDLVWLNPTTGKVAYWILNSNATQRSSGYIGNVTTGWTLVGTGDADGDKSTDLIWQNASQGRTAVWFLNPDGSQRSSAYSGNVSSAWTLASSSGQGSSP